MITSYYIIRYNNLSTIKSQNMIKYFKIFFRNVIKMAHYPRIRDLREDSDKKQAEVAEYLGTTKQYYSLYEKGANEISFERAIALAKYYNVSLDYIAGLTNEKSGFSKSNLTREQTELLKAAEKLSAADKANTLALLKAVINVVNKS